MLEFGDAYSPFSGLKKCPLVFENPETFTKLPNFGVYSIIYNRRRPKEYKPKEQHFSENAVPSLWHQLSPRPFFNIKNKKRDTLQFLVETQKYIHRIRKPQILKEESAPELPQKPSPKTEEKPPEILQKKQITFRYVGERKLISTPKGPVQHKRSDSVGLKITNLAGSRRQSNLPSLPSTSRRNTDRPWRINGPLLKTFSEPQISEATLEAPISLKGKEGKTNHRATVSTKSETWGKDRFHRTFQQNFSKYVEDENRRRHLQFADLS